MGRMENNNQRHSLALVAEGEIIKLQLLMAIAGVGEETFEKIGDQLGLDTVVVVLAVTPEANEPGHAQQCQMMAHCRLRLLQQVAQSRDVQLPILRQGQQNLQTGFVGQQFENLSESVDGSLGNLDGG